MVMGSLKIETDVLVIGAGPGGYVAALRAASLGMEVTLVDERGRLGGVCLIEGCIPSKTLIHAVALADSVRQGASFGLKADNISIDHLVLRQRKKEVVSELTEGIRKQLVSKGVEIIKGRARFVSDKEVAIEGGEISGINFRKAIIATGSRPRKLPDTKGLRLWYSAAAVNLPEVPKRLIVIGGGYIGLELGFVYAGLGSEVTLIEGQPELMGIADQDLVSAMIKSCSHKFKEIIVGNGVKTLEEAGQGFALTLTDGRVINGDKVLVSIGREPNTDKLDLEKAGVSINNRGLITVNEECKTNVPHIFAIGDCTPGIGLASIASREGKVAAEVIAKLPSAIDNRAIPSVVYTDPEIAWVGITEDEASSKNIAVAVGRFPLKGLGRARTLGRKDGFVKIIHDPESGLILGAGIVGPNASELISEATLAIEMGASLEDILSTIHPHPTLSEGILEATEVAAGTSVYS
jgi:dihydrolipoamide dehydrogenase